MTATVIIAAIAVVGLVVSHIVTTVLFREALRDTAQQHALDNARRDAQLSAMLDRFQAIRWEDLVAVRAYEEPMQPGGFLTPEEQRTEAMVEVDEQVQWGPFSRLRVAQEQQQAEEALLEEDFPDDYPARESDV